MEQPLRTCSTSAVCRGQTAPAGNSFLFDEIMLSWIRSLRLVGSRDMSFCFCLFLRRKSRHEFLFFVFSFLFPHGRSHCRIRASWFRFLGIHWEGCLASEAMSSNGWPQSRFECESKFLKDLHERNDVNWTPVERSIIIIIIIIVRGAKRVRAGRPDGAGGK